MNFGVMLHTLQHTGITRDSLETVARIAERAGFDILWVGDHITYPEQIPAEYPYKPDGTPPEFMNISQDIFEAFEVLSFVSGITDDIRLGPHVCVAPYRHPVYLARLALTLERLSEGRLEFGLGAGWMGTEFDVLDVPFEERGSRTDEFLDLFRTACEGGAVSFDGPHHSFDRTGFYPVPDRERVPVWIGGRSGAAFRRIAQYGDGWATVWDRPDEVRNERKRIMQAWEDYDRSGRPQISVTRPTHVGTDTELDTDRPMIGSPQTILGDIDRYAQAGATCLTVDFFTKSVDEQIEQIRRFGSDVIANVG